MEQPLRIAVVGGGISGITAAHVLAQRHEVTLFEAGTELGGHAHAVDVDDGAGGAIAVDTAFLIYNERHYPSFVALLHRLEVADATRPAEMSASFSDDDRRLHYALSRGLDALFVQRRNVLRPAFYRMFAELVAFRRRALRDLRAGRIDPSLTLRAYLAPYSPLFRENLVLPLATAIWSLPGELVLDYPAREILRFFHNHRLLDGKSGRAWRTFDGGSGVYVAAFAKTFPGRVRLATPVLALEREPGRASVVTAEGRSWFDHVVLATHADTSLALLAAPTAQERRLLGAWRYHPNPVTLHTDASVLHRDRRMWASWNIVKRGGRQRVTYWLNRVQSLRASVDYFLTLGRAEDVDPSRVVQRFSYRHPIFEAASVATQRELGSLDGETTSFCGSYAGHGFHEDGVAAALRVCRRFGLDLDSPGRMASPQGRETCPAGRVKSPMRSPRAST